MKPKKTFEDWIKSVDAALDNKCGLHHDDLADKPYYEWYELGMSANEAAKEALADEGADE